MQIVFYGITKRNDPYRAVPFCFRSILLPFPTPCAGARACTRPPLSSRPDAVHRPNRRLVQHCLSPAVREALRVLAHQDFAAEHRR